MRFHAARRVIMGLMGVALAWGMVGGTALAASKAPSDPYPLDTCPVSGKKLDKTAITKIIDGRPIKFCCAKCPSKFMAKKAYYMKKVDAAIIAKEKPTYAATTCPVSGQKLNVMGPAVDKVIGNRLVRFCCPACPAKYKADPANYSAKLDAEIIAAQKATYPLETCVVSGEKLGGNMGKPVDVVVQDRLVRLCCPQCKAKLMQDPNKYLSKIDAAAKAKKVASEAK